MLGIGKRIENLGERLSEAFYHRGIHYFQLASDKDGDQKRNFQLVGAIMSEISEVIKHVTKRDSESED
jgi:hypothetical protein